MKVIIRRNIFEINSSTNHTCAFSLQSKKKKETKDVFSVSELYHKANLIEWLFEETYFKTDDIYIKGALLSQNLFRKNGPLDSEFLAALNALLSLCDETDCGTLYELVAQRVESDEAVYFQKPDFRYLNHFEILEGGKVQCNLTDEKMDTLRCKAALLFLGGFGEDGLFRLFSHLADKCLDLDGYVLIDMMDSQVISVEKLHEKAVKCIG